MKRIIFLLIAVSLSYLINTYIVDSLLDIFKIISVIALLINRICLASLFYLIFDIIFIKKKFILKDVINKLFVIYLIWLIGLLFGRFTDFSEYSINDHFNFHSYLPKWINNFNNPLVRYYIIGNILVYIPFGMFIHYYKPIDYSILYCILLILLFETLQGVTNLGYFDIDDILLNGIGGILGVFIMHLFKKCNIVKLM